MPKIYDNIKTKLISGLNDALDRSHRSDIAVGYFNLRVWKEVASAIEKYKGGSDNQCRLLLGMYGIKKDIIEDEVQRIDHNIDNSVAKKERSSLLRSFRKQLQCGIPNNKDEAGIKKLVQQLRDKKVVIKCFTRYPLHAKLYLAFNQKEFAGKIGFLGSSNLTFSGLEKQGELNIDVLDSTLYNDLSSWFNERWKDKYSLDISEQVIKILEESWISDNYSPYDIYIKMAYHLSEDARQGLLDFSIPDALKGVLFEFQSQAVKIATNYIVNKNGVLIGDVVGLGKTLTATAIAKILEEDKNYQTLILCPANLVSMWESYRDEYAIRGKVLSIHKEKKLKELKGRYELVIIDESHNLRNKNSKRHLAIKDFIREHESKCILLSATPYNKDYKDLSSQISLFVDEEKSFLKISPEKFLKENKDFEGNKYSLKAFEKSDYPEDWKKLMDEFFIRRTRGFIKDVYAKKEGDRYYLEVSDKEKKFFPNRIPKTIRYEVGEQYGRLFSKESQEMIDELKLARYELSKYKKEDVNLDKEEQQIFNNLEKSSRGYPKGFCKIGFFKLLESSGHAFLQSIQRHIIKNCIFIYAIENGKDIFIRDKGNTIRSYFDDKEDKDVSYFDDKEDKDVTQNHNYFLTGYTEFISFAQIYYEEHYKNRNKNIRWISSKHFNSQLLDDIKEDTDNLIELLKKSKEWKPDNDLKLAELETLLTKECKGKKVLIFTQYSETANYICKELKKRGKVKNVEVVTGSTNNIQSVIKRFSPKSVGEKVDGNEIDVLVATDVVSEGQNLQDCHIVINYDLPWAIIKLVQRVGRVDRIGQKEKSIFFYSFVLNDELEKELGLMDRVRRRLKENAKVVGTDEKFFEDEKEKFDALLYHEKSKALEDQDFDVDISSYAYKIWNNAITNNPSLEDKIKNYPNSIHSSKLSNEKDGVLIFSKTQVDNHLLYLNSKGDRLFLDPLSILKEAKCNPNTPSKKKIENHHELVATGVANIMDTIGQVSPAGALGNRGNPRKKLYNLLEKEKKEDYSSIDQEQIELVDSILEDVFKYDLREQAKDTLIKKFRRKESHKKILEYVFETYHNGYLLDKREVQSMDAPPQIVCSMGLIQSE